MDDPRRMVRECGFILLSTRLPDLLCPDGVRYNYANDLTYEDTAFGTIYNVL
jgi:hypothetical protein